MSRKHIASLVLVLVGTVDGRGYDGQPKDAICDVRGQCQMHIQASCGDNDDRQTDYFNPVHVHRVITLSSPI